VMDQSTQPNGRTSFWSLNNHPVCDFDAATPPVQEGRCVNTRSAFYLDGLEQGQNSQFVVSRLLLSSARKSFVDDRRARVAA
jgi:hypothetical protein